jgi:hypothetical protein
MLQARKCQKNVCTAVGPIMTFSCVREVIATNELWCGPLGGAVNLPYYNYPM